MKEADPDISLWGYPDLFYFKGVNIWRVIFMDIQSSMRH